MLLEVKNDILMQNSGNKNSAKQQVFGLVIENWNLFGYW